MQDWTESESPMGPRRARRNRRQPQRGGNSVSKNTGRRAKQSSHLPKTTAALLAGGALLLAPIAPMFTEPAEATSSYEIIELETTGTAGAVSDMSFLATRSQSKTLTKSGFGPYVMTNDNSISSLSYSYPTDANYGGDHRDSIYFDDDRLQEKRDAHLVESDVRLASGGMQYTYIARTTSTAKMEIDGGIVSTPVGGQGANITSDGTTSYGSIFGPEVWSKPFAATSGQAVSYQWKATGVDDDYEVYGFLVKIADGADCTGVDASSEGGVGQDAKLASHSILAHARGQKANDFNSASGEVPSDGCYRFRFVNGTYDATGRYAVGATFEIKDPILGDPHNITLGKLNDRVVQNADYTETLTATRNSSQTVVFAEYEDSDVCEVASNGIVTIKAGETGQCTVRADAAATGSYAAAPTVYTSFVVVSEATEPVYSGGATITGDPLICSTLSAVEGDWGSGGATITSTAIQWLRDGNAISGATGSTYTLGADDVGESISFSVTKTNSEGSTTATSTGLLAIDARLTALELSSGSLSPSFDSCATSYTVTSTTDTIRVTPTISAGADKIEVNSIEVLSTEPTNPISLDPGSNTVTLEITSGIFSREITVTVNYLSAPTVVPLAPTMTSGTQVTLRASINANGYATSSISFAITQTGGTSQTPTQASLSPTSASGTSATTVTQAVTDLVSGGTYEFVAEAVNANGTTTSETVTFQTPDAPSVTTGNATNVDGTSADLAATVRVHNRDTDVDLLYSTNADLSNATSVSLSRLLGGAGLDQNVSHSITGLTTGVTYYYTFEATNSVGTNRGDVKSFVTIAAPTITHGSHNIGERSVTLVATINVNGSDTNQDIKFLWSTTSDFASRTDIVATPARLVAGGDRLVSTTISSLTPSTDYWFKVQATNSAGTSTSAAERVTTAADPVPTVTLSAASTIEPLDPISLTVRFSETVTGLQNSDLSITRSSGGPVYTAAPPQDLGSGVYQLTLTSSSNAEGTVTIGLPANKVQDTGSQGNTAATSIDVLVEYNRTATTIALSYPNPSDAPAATPTLNKGGSTGTPTYSVLSYTGLDAATGCAVNSSTGVASADSTGVCKIGVTVARDNTYLAATTDALVTLEKSSDTITWDTGSNKVTIRSVSGVNRTTTLTDSDSDGVYELEMKLGETVKIGFNTPNSQRVSYSSHGNCPSRIGWDESEMFPIDGNGDSFYYLKANKIGGCNLNSGNHVAQFLSLPSAIYTTPLSEGILVTVVKGDQSPITVTGNTSPNFGETVTLTATGGNGTGDRSYAVTGAGCSIETVPLVFGGVSYAAFASAELTNSGAGACQVTVTKEADSRYSEITSSPLTVTFGKGSQEISFTSAVPTNPATSDTYTPTASSSSGLTVSFSIAAASSAICSISSGVVTFDASGDCVIEADQSGDSDYNAATTMTQTIAVDEKNQTITFAAIPDKEFGDAPFSISPTTTESGAVITLTSANTGVCTVDNKGIVRLVAAGTCTIHADQPGTVGVVAAASRVSRNFEIYAAGASAPFITSVSRGLGSLTATLVPPTYTGGETITRYEVHAYDPNGDIAGVNNNCSVATGSNPQKCTVEGLAEGIAYTLRAQAHHTGGVGSLSPNSVALAPVGNPDAVRELTAVASNTSLKITWLSPLDLGGATFDRYELFIKLSTDSSFPNTPDHTISSSSSGNYTFTGLTNGASYDVKMVTITDVDTTELVSNSALVSQVPYTTPNAVRNLAAFELGNELYITWMYPDFDGGKPITGYDVDVDSGALSCTVTERLCVVSRDTDRVFDIDTLATNLAGNGPVASISFGTPPSSGNNDSGGGFFVGSGVSPQVFGPTLERQFPVVNMGGMRAIELRGSNLNLVSDVMMGDERLSFEARTSQLLRIWIRADSIGTMGLKLMYRGGELEQPITVKQAGEQKINAGTFKGVVAVYAKGYEGQRLSAKIGKDWVIVDSLESTFVRVVDRVGRAGFPINLRVYIDRRLIMTKPMITE